MKKNNKISKIVFFSLFTLVLLTICLVSYKITLAAINPSTTNQITVAAPNALGGSAFGQDIPHVITLIFNIIISASGAIFIILFLIGGIQYLFSSGNEEGTGKAKKLLLDAVIGLILVLSTWAIGTWVIDSLNKGTGSSNSGSTTPGLVIPSLTSHTPIVSPAVSATNSPTANSDTEILAACNQNYNTYTDDNQKASCCTFEIFRVAHKDWCCSINAFYYNYQDFCNPSSI